MKERPILFNGEMVRAILDGRKTQTRRVVSDKHIKRVPHFELSFPGGKQRYPGQIPDSKHTGHKEIVNFDNCPYGVPGDRLWVRETWKAIELENGHDGIRYRANGEFVGIENTEAAALAWQESRRDGDPWRPSIFMPRWASRISLEVTDVRVERLRDISEDDARAEGITRIGINTVNHAHGFAKLWDYINKARGYGWEVNPLVWVVKFKMV